LFSEPDVCCVVSSSNGHDSYHVNLFKEKRANQWECECAAFKMTRKECKHIQVAKSASLGKQEKDVFNMWKKL